MQSLLGSSFPQFLSQEVGPELLPQVDPFTATRVVVGFQDECMLADFRTLGHDDSQSREQVHAELHRGRGVVLIPNRLEGELELGLRCIAADSHPDKDFIPQPSLECFLHDLGVESALFLPGRGRVKRDVEVDESSWKVAVSPSDRINLDFDLPDLRAIGIVGIVPTLALREIHKPQWFRERPEHLRDSAFRAYLHTGLHYHKLGLTSG